MIINGTHSSDIKIQCSVKGKVNHAPQESVGRGDAHSLDMKFSGLEPVGGEPLMSVMCGQCDARHHLYSQLQGINAHWLVPNYTFW